LTALGLGLAFGGYLFWSYGFAMVKGFTFSISDLVLPSHRAATIATIIAGAPSQANIGGPQTSVVGSGSGSSASGGVPINEPGNVAQGASPTQLGQPSQTGRPTPV
jgi:hypothetical protein